MQGLHVNFDETDNLKVCNLSAGELSEADVQLGIRLGETAAAAYNKIEAEQKRSLR